MFVLLTALHGGETAQQLASTVAHQSLVFVSTAAQLSVPKRQIESGSKVANFRSAQK